MVNLILKKVKLFKKIIKNRKRVDKKSRAEENRR
jgi:hypothetical protein